jgi:hypothetical protein
MSIREQILNAQDLKREKVSVPEWSGVKIFVRTMTGAERAIFEDELIADGKSANVKNMREKLCAVTVVDENGNKVFTEKADVEKLGAKSSLVLDRIFQVAMRLNGISNAEVEELAKN